VGKFRLGRRAALAGAGALLAAPALVRAQTKSVTLGVGSAIIEYATAPLAPKLGFYASQGLSVQTQDFQAGGSKALQALVGGSVDVVIGSYDHTVTMQAQGKRVVGTVLLNNLPGVVFIAGKDVADRMHGPSDLKGLKGLKVGVTTLGSSTDMFARYWAARGGLAPRDVQVIAVGSGAPGMVALQNKAIDVLGCYDPIATLIVQRGLGQVLVDTRTPEGAQTMFGGSYPFACLYAMQPFLERNADTVQRLVNAQLSTLRWIRDSSAEQIVDALPASSRIDDRALNIQVVEASKPLFSTTGLFGADTRIPLEVLRSFDDKVKAASIDLSATFTNRFVEASPGI